MKIINTLSENKNLVLSLGFFDGVHIAHQKIISQAVSISKKENLKSAVITFEKSPASCFLNYPCFNITTNDKKTELIKELGVDYLYILDFEKFKNLSAKDYIENVLIKNFSPNTIITGFNHTFGANKSGNSKLLHQYKDFNYVELNEIKINDITVSSTNIKNFIQNGKIELANKMLGRNFSVSGNVVYGNQIARKLGYKTANIIFDKNIIKPKYGVYKGFVNYDGKKYQAIINFGIRPSIDKDLKETLEAHLINFDKEIYGENIEVEFTSKIRDEIKFHSFDELKNQIEKDFKSITL